VRIKRRMARIEGREPEKEELAIPPLRVSFLKVAYVNLIKDWKVLVRNSRL
jgi:hypothetical protein